MAVEEEGDLTSLAWLQEADLLKDFRACEETTHEQEEEDQDEEGEGEEVRKPPFSFSCLIFMAIEASPRKALPVKDIYRWIVERFPYFRDAPQGWKNSVRHNLSLSKCFMKVDRDRAQGKGSLWCIDPVFRPNLVQTLQKAPHLDSSCLVVSSPDPVQIPSPELFPFLSRRLASSIKDPEVDAAATMLALGRPVVSEESENGFIQHNSKPMKKRLRLNTCVAPPSEDHTYAGGSAEEEGAHALLHLAHANRIAL